MRLNLGTWLQLLRSLGQALQDLLRSELAALGDDLARSGRGLAVAVLLLLLALFSFFWMLGLLADSAVELAALWLPRWGAALVVAAAAALLGLVLALAARRKLRRLETPTATVRRRVTEHLDWWQDRVLGDVEAADELEGGDEEP